MPSLKNYIRNYKRERETAILRKETGCGSDSGDATRHRDRRKLLKTLENKEFAIKKDVHHIIPLREEGPSTLENLQLEDPGPHRSHGGRIGDRKGKAEGGRIANRTKHKKKTLNSAEGAQDPGDGITT